MEKLIPFVSILIIFAGCKKNTTPDPAIIKDIDGNVYNTVRIGNQLWLKENLNTTRYRNGDPIPNITDKATWVSLTTGAWCWYNNDSTTYAATYGKLYNWFAVNDKRGLAPHSSHVPSETEWTTLSTFLGGDLIAGGAMKEIGTTHWSAPNTDASNSSRFTGLPGGARTDFGPFVSIGFSANWWCSTEANPTNGFQRTLNHINDRITGGYYTKQGGYSVRCLMD